MSSRDEMLSKKPNVIAHILKWCKRRSSLDFDNRVVKALSQKYGSRNLSDATGPTSARKLSPLLLRLSLFASVLVFGLLACERQNTMVLVPSPQVPFLAEARRQTLTAPVLPSWMEVYFTNPQAPEATYDRGGPGEALVAAMDQARFSLEVAAYNLDLWSARDALLRAYRRGVLVRVVMESDNMDTPEVQKLIAEGIPVVGDQREGLMHDKFVIVDRSEVWLGSMNFSFGGAYRDHNNLLRLRSRPVAEAYLAEFEEMFTEKRFGPDSLRNTPHPTLLLDGVSLEVYFAPEDGVLNRLVQLINSANTSIYFLAYSFTSDMLGDAIRQRALDGVMVAGVMDADQAISNEGSEYQAFLQDGLDVRLDGNEGLMHHKVMIIDGCIVVTGSYNFSRSAEEKNDENLLIVFNQALAEKFVEEFWRLYAEALPSTSP